MIPKDKKGLYPKRKEFQRIPLKEKRIFILTEEKVRRSLAVNSGRDLVFRLKKEAIHPEGGAETRRGKGLWREQHFGYHARREGGFV